MNLIEKVNSIAEESKNKFKPDLVKYGKNFRAISESAILDVLNPLFKEHGVAYDVKVKEQQLHIEKVNAGRDYNGNLIQRLVFVAEAKVCLTVCSENEKVGFEGWGMGIDSGDKATGKAITAATKYALLKGFRLQYSDDPDAEASQEIEDIIPEESKPAKEEKKAPAAKKDDPLVTEAMLSYISSLCSSAQVSDEEFKKKFKFLPFDSNMPMRVGREAIDYLKKVEDQKLPF